MIGYLFLCFALSLIVLATCYALAAFARGFVLGYFGTVIDTEVSRRVERDLLAAANVLRVGDRMQFSGALLRQLHRVGDGEIVTCEVVEIGDDGDGGKRVVIRNEPKRSGDAFWKHRV